MLVVMYVVFFSVCLCVTVSLYIYMPRIYCNIDKPEGITPVTPVYRESYGDACSSSANW